MLQTCTELDKLIFTVITLLLKIILYKFNERER
jgi:hypothetical protein